MSNSCMVDIGRKNRADRAGCRLAGVLAVLAMFAAPVLHAQENADFSAANGAWSDGEGPPGWRLVLAEADQRGVVEDFSRALSGDRAFRFSRATPNFGTNRLEQCLPVAGIQELRMRVIALTDTPDNGLALRLRMDFFQDAECSQDAPGASQARVETDHVIGPSDFDAGEWGELVSAGRLAGALAAEASHVRISVRQRDRSNDGAAAQPPLRLWLDRVDLIDMGVRIDAHERDALLALYHDAAGEHWYVREGWGGPVGSECDWYGVVCSADRRRVEALDLSYNGLQGSVPAELADLVHLRADDGLRLCWNDLESDSDSLDAFVSGHHLGGDWLDCQGAEPVPASRGFAGVWSDPERPGERLMVTPLSEQSMLLDWASFDQAGEQIWFVGQGKARLRQFRYPQVMMVHRADGQVQPGHAGQAELSFIGCNQARLAFAMELDGVVHHGSRWLQRMDADGQAQHCVERPPQAPLLAMTGQWFDADRSGEGLIIQPLSEQALALHWLSYDADGAPRAWHGRTPFFPMLSHYAIPFWRSTGGRFDVGVGAQDIIDQPAGIAILIRTGPGQMHLIMPGDPAGYQLQRIEGYPALQASAPNRVNIKMAPAVLNELYSRPLRDDTLLPAAASLGDDAPVQTLSGIRFRGNSSRALPKKGFHVRFVSPQPVLFGSDRMNLMANWTDPSMLRQTIALAMFRDLGLMASRTRQFDLFLNGIYEGLYTHVQRVDGKLLAMHGRREGTLVRDQFRGDPDIPVSSLFGFDLGAIAEDERAAFVAARFDSRGSPDWSALVELALWQQSTPAGTAFAEGFEQRFDVDHFIDWLALHILIGDVDAFGDDYWLHLDPDDGLWRTLPWDKDLSFGKHYRGGAGVANDYFYYEYPVNSNHGNRLVLKVLDTPSLRARLNQRVLELGEQVFTPDYFQTEVSALTEVLLDSIEIQPGPVAFHRHPANHHGALGKHALHREVMAEFVQLRSRFLSRRIHPQAGTPGQASVQVPAAG
ncbi:MAG: CotH kinase family protein, partial [Lysobacterales bacterium]